MTPILPYELADLDQRLTRVGRRVRVLAALAWPNDLQTRFLEGFRRGAPELPDPPRPKVNLDGATTELEDIVRRSSMDHPLAEFVRRTAQSYLDAARMLEGCGTPAFTEVSRKLYGGPRDVVHRGGPSHLDAARHFLATSEGLPCRDSGPELGAEAAAAHLQSEIDAYFTGAPLPVVLDDELTAMATAGAGRVRLRGGRSYTATQLQQLLQHEALVHSATKRNGQAQPALGCMGLSAPRTTLVQEGLATLAELLTGTMDLARLRRIALRIVAIDAALEGANFLEVFAIFLEAGEDDVESYNGAVRVFRGGDVRGRTVFTKDVVYLRGALLVHTFLLETLQRGRPELPRRLFAGRMTLGDVVDLDPMFEAGVLRPAGVVPDWISNHARLAARLSWSAFNTRLHLDAVTLQDFD